MRYVTDFLSFANMQIHCLKAITRNVKETVLCHRLYMNLNAHEMSLCVLFMPCIDGSVPGSCSEERSSDTCWSDGCVTVLK